MREFTEVQREIAKFLGTSLEKVLCDEVPWRQEFDLGPDDRPRGTERSEVDAWVGTWREIAKDLPSGAHVLWSVDRRPAWLQLDDLDAAAGMVGGFWPERVARARTLRGQLRDAGWAPSARRLRGVLTKVGDDQVFARELVAATEWISKHEDLSIWTARQAGPDAGLHSKWFEDRSGLLKAMWEFDVVGSMQGRPRMIQLRYADPDYLSRGGVRRYDSWTTGDPLVLAYRPDVVVIVENKDSWVSFPDLPGGVVVYGGGDAAPPFLADMMWPAPRPTLVYWGDIDRDGFEILSGIRRALGKDVRSLLMDESAYEWRCDRGVVVDRKGRPLSATPRAHPLELLELAEERADRLACSDGVARRIEQEAFAPADVADAISRVLAS